MKKIWLDTDIGSDIDDSICLNYLLKNEACELLGITTVGGHGRERAMVASCMCKLEKQDIPIYVGAQTPLIGKQLQEECQQADFLKKYSHDSEFGDITQGLADLRNQIMMNPKEVTILAIGSMTNVALLLSTYPEVKENLAGLTMMIGRFRHSDSLASHTPICEWNCICDPHAAHIVFHSDIENVCCISLDITQNLLKQGAVVKEMIDTEGMKPVFDYFDQWEKLRGEIIFHDPVAAVSIFHPEWFNWKEANINVSVQNTPLMGLTYDDENLDRMYAAKYADAIDKDKVFEHFTQTFEKGE